MEVTTVYCGKTADWIKMPSGVVDQVGSRNDLLDWGQDPHVKWQFCGERELGRRDVT